MIDNLCNNQGGGYDKRNYTISLERLISLLMIIICHIMQYNNFFLAWWFNVGVQIFLCISGFLYGKAEDREVTEFYKSRFTKILTPYYITFFCFSILEFFFFRDNFSFLRFIAGIFCRTTISGGEHLWFVGYILLCYVLTPLLNAYRNKYINNKKTWIVFSLVVIFIATLFFGLFFGYFNPAWIVCYIIGYVIGANEKRQLVSLKYLVALFGVCSIIGNGFQIYIDYIKVISFTGLKGIIYGYFCNYNHVVLGTFFFLVMKMVFDHIRFKTTSKKLLNIADKYSYEIYLVHQFLILGPFSLMGLTSVISLNILLILVGIVILAWLLKKGEELVLQWLQRINI